METNKTSKKEHVDLPIAIVRYSDRPKPKLTPEQIERVIEELSASTKRAMGKKFREELFNE